MTRARARRTEWICVLMGVVWLAACGPAPVTLISTPAPSLTPLPGPPAAHTAPPPTAVFFTPLPSPTREPADTGWQAVQPGVELRQVLVPTGQVVERLAILRLVPGAVRFRVRYDPAAPRPVSRWAEEPGTLLAVNGGYFSQEYDTVALLVADGRQYGPGYGSYAGMFAVATDGQVGVRWLAERPYDTAEALDQALQSFPVLVKPGGIMGFPVDADDGSPARRTIVAQDTDGRILFILAPRGYLSLHQTAVWLAEQSDLELDVALNLDGGPSSGLWMTVEPAVRLDSLVPVPSAIVVTTP